MPHRQTGSSPSDKVDAQPELEAPLTLSAEDLEAVAAGAAARLVIGPGIGATQGYAPPLQ